MSDPPRLVDARSKSPAALRAMLRAAKSDLPSDARLRELDRRFALFLRAASGGAPLGAAGGHAGAPLGAGLASAVKLSASAVLVFGLTTGVYIESYRSIVKTVPSASVKKPAASTPGPARASERAAAPTIGPVPTPTSAAVSAPAPLLAKPAANPMKALAIETPAADERRMARDEADGETEIALLQQAADDLRTNPEAALVLAERHASRFPSGGLAQEREVIAIEALARLHRAQDAHMRAARFFRDFPASAHTVRVNELLAPDR